MRIDPSGGRCAMNGTRTVSGGFRQTIHESPELSGSTNGVINLRHYREPGRRLDEEMGERADPVEVALQKPRWQARLRRRSHRSRADQSRGALPAGQLETLRAARLYPRAVAAHHSGGRHRSARLRAHGVELPPAPGRRGGRDPNGAAFPPRRRSTGSGLDQRIGRNGRQRSVVRLRSRDGRGR